MRGIVLAGGIGSRLKPLTSITCKQLLPVYDKPMIYYPLSTLMLSGIREVLMIVTPNELGKFQEIFRDGSRLGMRIEFATQILPEGIPQAFIIGEKFIGNESVALILGDNVFHGLGLDLELKSLREISGAQIFAHKVSNPQDYGVISFDEKFNPVAIVEKPKTRVSEYAIPGLYFYDSNVVNYAKGLSKSARNEYEIVDLNKIYLSQKKLNVKLLPGGTAWLDMGTFESLHDASSFVRVLEQRQGQKIGCIEEISWRNGWISDSELQEIAKSLNASGYGNYLLNLMR